MRLFTSLEAIKSRAIIQSEYENHPKLKALFKTCFNLQPLGERTHSCMADLTDWLSLYEDHIDISKQLSNDAINSYQLAWEVNGF
jgi:hypothetical protein